MKVVAINPGFYNLTRIFEGAEFELTDDKHFSVKWMKVVEEAEENKPKKSFKKDFTK